MWKIVIGLLVGTVSSIILLGRLFLAEGGYAGSHIRRVLEVDFGLLRPNRNYIAEVDITNLVPTTSEYGFVDGNLVDNSTPYYLREPSSLGTFGRPLRLFSFDPILAARRGDVDAGRAGYSIQAFCDQPRSARILS